MKNHSNLPALLRRMTLVAFLTLLSFPSAHSQTFEPTNWVNDPFCFNPNFGVVNAESANPSFTNNAVNRGTLYANSPIGARLTLSPGDSIAFTGQVKLTGDVNPDGDMQFRVGLLFQGDNAGDTNWLGYFVGNPAGSGLAATNGLFIRNNPNPGTYLSGSTGNAMRPHCDTSDYAEGWSAGDYDVSLIVTELSPKAQAISWSIHAIAPGRYRYSGAYTNSFEPTLTHSFDQVGILGGAALFNSASSDATIQCSNLKVTLTKSGSAK